jgi:UDP-N-acetylmuramate: L-alanyl-gamma-D-glutamyl-meso-diaminopimelate ligase
MSKIAQLDPNLNKAPDNCRHIHIMGICGTGMAALAGMLKKMGFQVTGSDENVYPPMSDFLASCHIPIMAGYGADNLQTRPDLVVVGNVITGVNTEAVALADLRINYLSMPQALAHFALTGRTSLVVTGTHGKTTTSAILATALEHIGASPGFMIGGIVEAFASNFHVGDGQYFIVEGDEYDTAFFNKVSKFLHYQPFHAILTSIEFDHADIFADIEEIKESFAEFVSLIPGNGSLFFCMDDDLAASVATTTTCPVFSYGTGADCFYQLTDMEVQGLNSQFTVLKAGQLLGKFTLALPGLHNCLNSTAVVGMLDQLGFSKDEIKNGIASFAGVKRRQQLRGEVDGIKVIDDFAHHPTAVRETISALRLAWPEQRLVVVFEPRTNSSRRSIFQDSYGKSFPGADLVVVREHVPLAGIAPEEQFSPARLVQELNNQGIDSHYFPDTDTILDFLCTEARRGDIIVIFSNGGFDNIHERLLTRLTEDRGQRAEDGGRRMEDGWGEAGDR